MKIEVSSKRILFEAGTVEDEKILQEVIDHASFPYSFRRFFELERFSGRPAQRMMPITPEEAEARKKRHGVFTTIIEMHGFENRLFETIRLAMEAVGVSFVARGMIKSCRTEVVEREEDVRV